MPNSGSIVPNNDYSYRPQCIAQHGNITKTKMVCFVPFVHSNNRTITFILQNYVVLHSASTIGYARIIGSRIGSDLANQ